jgi:hypothetical protein
MVVTARLLPQNQIPVFTMKSELLGKRLSSCNMLLVIEFPAPPALPIPGLQQPSRSPTLATKSQQASTVPANQPPSVSSKSLPATPASTPQIEQQPSGFITRLFGSSNKQNKPAAVEQMPGMVCIHHITCLSFWMVMAY